MNEYTKALKETLSESSTHGIPQIIKSKRNFIKAIWFIFFLIFIGFCAYFLFKSIKEFFKFEVITNINVVRETRSEFPTLTVCVSSHSKNDPSIDNILIECSYEKNKCNSTDFEIYSFDSSETCYRFNSGVNSQGEKIPIKTISKTDIFSSLRIILYIEYQNSFFLYHGSRARVFIQNSSSIFRLDNYFLNQTFFPSPAGVFNLKFQRELIEKLSYPYNQCVKQDSDYDSNLFKYFIKNNKTYTQKDCFDFCADEFIINSCNCSAELGQILSKCFQNNNLTTNKCIETKDSIESNQEFFTQNCLNKCPLECDYIKLNVISNLVPIEDEPINYYLKMYPRFANYSIEKLKKGIVYIIANYQDLQYNYLTEIPKYDSVDLISNIGGTLSLFLGMSFFSLIEFVVIPIEFAYIHFKSKIKNLK